MPAEPEPTHEKPSLSSFIEANHKLLQMLGIFTALTIFAINLPLRAIGQFLSFLFLGATVLIWLELLTKFPSQRGSALLIWFENILSFALLGIVAFWLMMYRDYWRVILWGPIGLVLSWGSSVLIKRYKLYDAVLPSTLLNKKWARYLVFYAILAVIIVVSYYLAYLLNMWLDQARHGIEPTGK